MGKFALILVASFTFVFATIKNELNTISENAVDTLTDHYEKVAVRVTAASAVNIALGEFSADENFTGSGYSNISLNGCTFTIGVVDSTVVLTLNSEQNQITSTATTASDTASNTVIVEKKEIVPEITTAMSVNASLSSFRILGNPEVSGIDMDGGGTDLPGITFATSADSAVLSTTG